MPDVMWNEMNTTEYSLYMYVILIEKTLEYLDIHNIYTVVN